MALKLITAATVPVVTLAEAKLHLRVDITDDDLLIQSLVEAATELVEQATGRALMPQTWELTLDAFPDRFEITRVPAVSVTSIKYVDTAGVTQTLSAPLYVLDNTDDYGCAYVNPVYAGVWPNTRQQSNAVALRYVAGWPDAASVPDGIKAWIKLQIGAMYENRSAEGAVQTHALGFTDRLLDRYTVWKL